MVVKLKPRVFECNEKFAIGRERQGPVREPAGAGRPALVAGAGVAAALLARPAHLLAQDRHVPADRPGTASARRLRHRRRRGRPPHLPAPGRRIAGPGTRLVSVSSRDCPHRDFGSVDLTIRIDQTGNPKCTNWTTSTRASRRPAGRWWSSTAASVRPVSRNSTPN